MNSLDFAGYASHNLTLPREPVYRSARLLVVSADRNSQQQHVKLDIYSYACTRPGKEVPLFGAYFFHVHRYVQTLSIPTIFTDYHQPVHLKRPVTRRGSILLGELVAILITLEYMLENLTTIPCRLLKIFSDSQSTVGILTLNWRDTSYREVTKDIRKFMSHLQQRNTAEEIDWTHEHSSIAGNEMADKMAKEAAMEASKFPEDKTITSHPEIKLACTKYIRTQWQRRWEQSDTGRDYYNYFPTLEFNRLFDQPNKEAFSWLLQLQSGYTRLNSYRHKLGQVPSDKCGTDRDSGTFPSAMSPT